MTVVEHLLSRLPWTLTHVTQQPDGGGAVVVLPGGGHDPHAVTDAVAPLEWVVLAVTSDEGSHFDVDQFHHPVSAVWVQNPRSDRHNPDVRALPVGWTPHIDRRYAGRPPPDKTLRWTFAGQVTHSRRRDAVAAMRRMSGGRLVTSEAFTEGVPPDEYADMLYDAAVAPCPAGIVTPDTFRCWEALRAGAVPVVDRQAGEWDVPGDYWRRLCGRPPPFKVVDDWSTLPGLVDAIIKRWPRDVVRAGGWWSGWLHRLRRDLAADVATLSGVEPDRMLAVYVPTSPIPAHPDTSVIEATVDSVRERLPDAPVHVAADGVRDEQSHLAGQYREYLRRLLWLTQHRWDDVTVHTHRRHRHQSGMLHTVLPQIDAPTLLYVEHDAPLVGDIPFEALVQAVAYGAADVVRLHYDVDIHPDHRHLYPDDTAVEVAGVPLLRTAQWSQRPHVAATAVYRRIADRYFGRRSRTMIEDVMHGVVATDFAEHGWGRWRLYTYAPAGSMKRSTHLDARGSEPKFPMVFDYDGEPPEFAPAPTADRST